ncbi:PepSY domain-containing protein [Macrococcus brunensis]|uniref:PepSY domain-containing protein n=1 Tax=Macrococcus brunensis TaxID=198483 RepID=UPI001EF0103F|nr:PepSY domain-containing protein [Macrococcus brunensis]ULG71607.1 PepSY domain-containing protein [Macrococcus brunensis]
MKFKALGLILSAGLALAACDADNSNDKQTSPDDNAQSEVNSGETNKSSDVKSNEDANVTKDSDDNDMDDSNDAEKDDEDQTSSSTATNSEQALAIDDIKSTPDDIIKVIESQKKKGEITDIKFEKENNEWVYKIGQNEGNKHVEYTYGMDSRKLISTEEDNEKDTAINLDKAMNYDDLIKKVKDKVGNNAKVKEWSLDTEDDIPVFKATLLDGTTEHEYNVDPFSGAVTEDK